MTHRFKTLLATLIFSALAVPTVWAAEDHDQKKAEAWAKYMEVTEHHEFLAKGAGCWDVETTMYEGPGKEPVKSKAIAKDKMIFGGRYLKSYFKGEFGGMPFTGIGYTGYDNAAKKFVSTWLDSMSSGIAYMTGDLDESGKSITFFGEMVNPVTGKNQKFKSVSTHVNDDKQTFEMFDIAEDGSETKTFEMVYTRHGCGDACKKGGCPFAKGKCCGKDGKCCKAKAKCCGKDGKCCAKDAKSCSAKAKCCGKCGKSAKACSAKKSCSSAAKSGCSSAKSCSASKTAAAAKCPVTGKTGTCTAQKHDGKTCPVTGKTGKCTRHTAAAHSGCPHAEKAHQEEHTHEH